MACGGEDDNRILEIIDDDHDDSLRIIETYEYVHATNNESLKTEYVCKLLIDFDPLKNVYTDQLKEPKAGQITFFYSTDESKKDDWTVDHCQWKSDGIHDVIVDDIVIKRYYYNLKLEAVNEKNECIVSKKFKKNVYKLKDKNFPVLIHYRGDDNELKKKKTSHGNNNNENKKYHRSKPSLINEIKNQLKYKTTQEVYKANNGKDDAPRNSKQVSNFKYAMNSEKRFSKDEYYNIIALDLELKCLRFMSSNPNIRIVIGDLNIINHVKSLMAIEKTKVMFQYDTTFNLCDYFVSPLLVKYTLFNEEPFIPVAFFIHENKDFITHRTFFLEFVHDYLPNFETRVIVVTDQESAFKKALKFVFPNIELVRCWNHLWTALDHWLSKRKGNNNDKLYYQQSLKTLISQKSKQEYEQLLAVETKKWDLNFVDYFNKQINSDIDSLGRWTLEKHGIYNPISGITTNPSEGFNSLLKQLVKRTEIPSDVAILCFHHLQIYYDNEILRGHCNEGKFSLKSKHQCLRLEKQHLCLRQAIAPEDILEKVTDQIEETLICQKQKLISSVVNNQEESNQVNQTTSVDALVSATTELSLSSTQQQPQESQEITSKESRAKYFIENKMITFTNAGVFIVKNECDKPYMIQLFPKPSCTCAAKFDCCHILACQLSIGYEPPASNKKKPDPNNLSKLCGSRRGYKKYGRKHQFNDEDSNATSTDTVQQEEESRSVFKKKPTSNQQQKRKPSTKTNSKLNTIDENDDVSSLNNDGNNINQPCDLDENTQINHDLIFVSELIMSFVDTKYLEKMNEILKGQTIISLEMLNFESDEVVQSLKKCGFPNIDLTLISHYFDKSAYVAISNTFKLLKLECSMVNNVDQNATIENQNCYNELNDNNRTIATELLKIFLDARHIVNLDQIMSGEFLVEEEMVNYKTDEINKQLKNFKQQIDIHIIRQFCDVSGFEAIKRTYDIISAENNKCTVSTRSSQRQIKHSKHHKNCC